MLEKLCGCCKKPDKKRERHRGEVDENLSIEENKPKKTFAYAEKGHGKKKTECQDTFCLMENFYKDMTFLAVYDGHGANGRTASDLVNNNVQKYL